MSGNTDEQVQVDASSAVLRLDSNLVHASRWIAARTLRTTSKDFKALKKDVREAGGNLQPIEVRMLSSRPGHYEVVTGHRRHLACSLLGLPVNAQLVTREERDMFVSVVRDGYARGGYSPFELGKLCNQAIDEGLFKSRRIIAPTADIDAFDTLDALVIAALPHQVISSFPTPHHIKYQWGRALSSAVGRDEAVVTKRALEISQSGAKLSASKVFALLLGKQKAVRSAR